MDNYFRWANPISGTSAGVIAQVGRYLNHFLLLTVNLSLHPEKAQRI